MCNRLAALLPRHPRSATLHNILGVLEARLERWPEAEAALRRVVALAPDYPGGHMNLGNVLRDRGAPRAALDSLTQAVRLAPQDATARVSLGHAFMALHREAEALEHYRVALDLDPSNAQAWNGVGLVSLQHCDAPSAVDFFRHAHRLDGASAEYAVNLGLALLRLRRMDEGARMIDCAATLPVSSADQHAKLAYAMEILERRDEAIRHERAALAINPTREARRAHLHHQLMHVCAWGEFEEIMRAAPAMGLGDAAIDPFTMLAIEDAPERQLRRARAYARSVIPDLSAPAFTRRPLAGRRLRIGYFAGDPHNHATMLLMSGLIRSHDRERFEIVVLSYAPGGFAPAENSCLAPQDRLIDVTGMSREETAARARALELDVLVDLKGYTQGSRFPFLADRMAPVQVHYLSYPGSLGADCVDYIVADPVVAPPEWRWCYHERIIYLPDCYQPNDDRRMIAPETGCRADHGLPADGVVLCCFNQPCKITPREFDVWMRVLQRVPDAVLWLIRSNGTGVANLRREAAARGVSPDRLVFAEKVAPAAHLARHAHADLFVDTFNYNAHTTASDALWAGLPVVTKLGDQFAARVAASLLKAVGLPELVTRTVEDYAALILGLAADRGRLAAVRARLAAARATVPLFDTARYTRHFEAGLAAAAARHAEGAPPADIFVNADAASAPPVN